MHSCHALLSLQLNHDYPANDNVDMYCISMRWFKQWEMFVKGQEDGMPQIIIVVESNSKRPGEIIVLFNNVQNLTFKSPPTAAFFGSLGIQRN